MLLLALLVSFIVAKLTSVKWIQPQIEDMGRTQEQSAIITTEKEKP